MAEQYRRLLANPRAVPGKALGYAKYDLVRVLNSGLDTLGLHDSIVEKVLARTLAVPAARFFRIRRSVHLLVGEPRATAGTDSWRAPTRAPSSCSGRRAPAPPACSTPP